MIAHNPLHRSGRARFTHPALALGDDAKSPQGIGMTDIGIRKPLVDQSFNSFPGDFGFLTSTLERMMPVPSHLESKRVQSSLVSRHTVIADMSSDYRFQPRSNFRNGVMHSFPEFCFDQLQFGSHLFLNRLAIK